LAAVVYTPKQQLNSLIHHRSSNSDAAIEAVRGARTGPIASDGLADLIEEMYFAPSPPLEVPQEECDGG
jgi:hypothetical protein